MSVSRIGEFKASEGKTDELRDFMPSVIPIILSSEGCESCQLFQNQEDPSKFLMIETWDSIESHQASVKNIPPDMLSEIRPLLASSPSGGYFDEVVGT